MQVLFVQYILFTSAEIPAAICCTCKPLVEHVHNTQCILYYNIEENVYNIPNIELALVVILFSQARPPVPT